MAVLMSWCGAVDPNPVGPVILHNSLADSVWVAIHIVRHAELTDTSTLDSVVVASRDSVTTTASLMLLSLTDSGVPTNTEYVLTVSTRNGWLWTSQIRPSWWTGRNFFVRLGISPPRRE